MFVSIVEILWKIKTHIDPEDSDLLHSVCFLCYKNFYLESDEDVERMFSMTHKIDGKAVDLRRAETRSNPSAQPVASHSQSHSTSFNSMSSGNNGNRDNDQEQSKLSKKLFVGGLTFGTTEDQMRFFVII